MQFCQDHWDELRNAIIKNGLEKFIAKDGIEASKMFVAQHNNPEILDNFEPLLGAFYAIFQNSLQCGASYLMFQKLCPICEGIKNTDYVKDWIRLAADDQLEIAKRKGLVK